MGDTWGGTALHTYHATGIVIISMMLITSRNPYHKHPHHRRVSPRLTILCNPKIYIYASIPVVAGNDAYVYAYPRVLGSMASGT
jgi:hypothetical protein